MTGDADRRRAVRAYVRAHHPDRGGDPDAFAAGLAALRSGRAGEEITFHRRETGVRAVLAWVRKRRARGRRPPRVR